MVTKITGCFSNPNKLIQYIANIWKALWTIKEEQTGKIYSTLPFITSNWSIKRMDKNQRLDYPHHCPLLCGKWSGFQVLVSVTLCQQLTRTSVQMEQSLWLSEMCPKLMLSKRINNTKDVIGVHLRGHWIVTHLYVCSLQE